MNRYAFVAVIASTTVLFITVAVTAKVASDKYLSLLNRVSRLETR